jgi:hypothetical protein
VNIDVDESPTVEHSEIRFQPDRQGRILSASVEGMSEPVQQVLFED